MPVKKNKIRNLFWILSFLCVAPWGIGRILHPEACIFHHDFFLIKYALDLLIVNLAIVLFIWPFFIDKGIAEPDYNNAGPYEQTKMYLIAYGLLSPSIFLLFIAAVITREALPPVSLLIFFYNYVYIKKIVFFCRHKNKREIKGSE